MSPMLKNWKTGLPGLVMILLVLALILKAITFDQFIKAAILLAGGGLLAAQDAQKQKPE